MHVIQICENLEDVLQSDDKELNSKLLKSGKMKVALEYSADSAVDIGEIIQKVDNIDNITKRARELLKVFKYEVVKDDLFETVRLCGKDPGVVLKKWYGEPLASMEAVRGGKKKKNEAITQSGIGDILNSTEKATDI